MLREKHDNLNDWLEARKGGIGASECAVVLGLSPWKTIDELYDEKIGLRPVKDISDNPAVKFGHAAEKHIRGLTQLDLANQYDFEYHPYDIIRHDEYPFIFATLDCELLRKEDREKGVLEIKTGSFKNADDLAPWDAGLPNHYAAQGIQQLLCTGWKYNIFHARLKRDGYMESDMGLPAIKTYYRIMIADSMTEYLDYVLKKLCDFWYCVQKQIRPKSLITFDGTYRN